MDAVGYLSGSPMTGHLKISIEPKDTYAIGCLLAAKTHDIGARGPLATSWATHSMLGLFGIYVAHLIAILTADASLMAVANPRADAR